MAATLDPETRTTLEDRLMELEGVLHAAVDPRTGEVWVVRDPAHDKGPLELAIRNRIASLGHDPSQIPVRTSLPTQAGPRRRVRFVGVDREESAGQTTITVSLEWNDDIHTGQATGEKGHALELKTTAQATLNAIEKLAPEGLDLRIIGIKPIHAFDSDLMVASLLRTDGSSQRLVGAVVATHDLLSAVAMAVLSALNRTLGNFLHTSD